MYISFLQLQLSHGWEIGNGIGYSAVRQHYLLTCCRAEPPPGNEGCPLTAFRPRVQGQRKKDYQGHVAQHAEIGARQQKPGITCVMTARDWDRW
jgi:hypothetical protein